jgi:hypothetical protein
MQPGVGAQVASGDIAIQEGIPAHPARSSPTASSADEMAAAATTTQFHNSRKEEDDHGG